MIRVLVVDDEKLVRKGLIVTIPWASFGMEVAAEAGSAREALECLADGRGFDLMLTDLEMPGMSGIELIRVVRAQYPAMQVVVLTFHQEFEYIQETLRLGIADYISKTELDDESIGTLFTRIALTIEDGKRRQKKAEAYQVSEISTRESVYALFPENACAGCGGDVTRFDISYEEPPAAGVGEDTGICRLELSGVLGMPRRSIEAAVDKYLCCGFFYEYRPGQAAYRADFAELLKGGRILLYHDFEKLVGKWSSLAWVAEDAAYKAMLDELTELRLLPQQVGEIMQKSHASWQKFLADGDTELPQLQAFGSFMAWRDWLDRARLAMADRTMKRMLALDISTGLKKAVDYIQGNFHKDITLEEVAEVANLSKSYFCSCFKDFTGQTFIDFLHAARIRHACSLIAQQPQRPLYWIAYNSGFTNEKYFSRVFRQITGVLPRDYRRV